MMENRFEVTDEIMEKAETYMPILLKERIVTDTAWACVREVKVLYKDEEKAKESAKADASLGLSPIMCESSLNKSRVMLTILMAFYLKVWDASVSLLCSVDDYDAYMGAHVLNQLERYKNTKYREKVFDILADYKDVEKRLNSAIYSLLREANDPARRLIVAMTTLDTPKNLSEALEVLRQAQEGILAENIRQDQIIRGGEEGNADGE